MTPAAKPIMISSNLRLIFLKKKTMARSDNGTAPSKKTSKQGQKRPHFDVKAKSQTHPPTNGQKDWLRTDFQV